MEPSLPRSQRLIDQLRQRIRYCHYSLRTEQAYVFWARRFIRFHGMRHPREMGAAEVEQFLSNLVIARKASASTHKQALAAILFLYRDVLGIELPWMQDIGRPRAAKRVPVVLSRDEMARLLACIDAAVLPIAQLLYGAGLRLSECLQLRVKDVDFDRRVIVIRDGKGAKDRVVMLPAPLQASLKAELAKARVLWLEDRAHQAAGVALPDGLAHRLPRAGESWAWFWVFPSTSSTADPRSGVLRRHHRYWQVVGRALARAAVRAQIDKRVTAHALRHYLASRTM